MERSRGTLRHKIAVVGCGEMSNVWIDYAIQRGNAEIVCLVDVNISAAKSMAERKGLNVPVYANLYEALTESGATLVFDVTIPEVHKEIVLTAMEAGCHVFGEKPMAESMEDAKEVLATVQHYGKKYAVMQNRRYLKQIRAFQKLVSKEAVGTIGSIHADFFLGPHFGGFRDAMEHPLILDMAIHTFDQARFITGSDPVSVYCHEYNPPGSWYKGNASAICIFEMTNGIVFSYRGSWCAEGNQTSWEADWRATGTNGSIIWDGFHLPTYEVIDDSQPMGFLRPVKSVLANDSWDGHEGHWGCLDEMFSALEENRMAETECHDNIKSMAMVFGAIESAKKMEKVYL